MRAQIIRRVESSSLMSYGLARALLALVVVVVGISSAGCGEGDGDTSEVDLDHEEELADLEDLTELADLFDLSELIDSFLDGDGPADIDGETVGLNLPPNIEVVAPTEGASFGWQESVAFSAVVTDDFDVPSAVSVEWSSPIQGVFFVGTPDVDGRVELSVADLVLGAHLLTLSAVDSEGAQARATVLVQVVADGAAPVIRVVPASPVTTDELLAEVTDPKLDAGAGGLAVQWSWFRGADPVVAGERVAASETTKGETWRVVGVVSNGVDETPPGVAQVTIANSAPRCVGGASIIGDAGVVGRLVCGCDERVDEDEADPVEDRCVWTVDGSIFETSGETTESCRLESEGMAAGARIGCQVVPFDGEDEGVGVAADEFVVPDPNGNTPPTMPGVAVSPSFGKAGHRFTCEVVAASVDAQGDTVSYAVSWSVNGHWNAVAGASVVPSLELFDAAGEAAGDGDVLRCRVVASDGVAQSAAALSDEVRLGTVGVSVGVLGDVVLDEALGDGCYRDAEVALPSCAADLFCSVAVTACFDEDGDVVGAPVVSAVVELPGLGTVVLEGVPGGGIGDDGWCISGHPADLGPPVVPLPLSGLTLKSCSGADGVVTSSLSGNVTMEGEVYPFVDAAVGTEVVGQGADGIALKIEIPLPSFRLGGTRFGGRLSLGMARTGVAFDGEVTLAGIGQVELDGTLETAGRADGALVSARLDAGVGLEVKGLTFAGAAALTLAGGVWRLGLEDGVMTLPGGSELMLSGAIEVVAGRLTEAEFDAGAGVTFAGVEFAGDATVRWSAADQSFGLELSGGLLGPEGPSFDVGGTVVIEDGVVVAGALTAGADMVLAGVQFAGDAVVSWEDNELFVGLAAGVVGLPGGADVRLSGEVTLADGVLADASFVGAGSASIAGVDFGGEISASWSGAQGSGWSVALSGGRVVLPGGQEVILSGSLAVSGGRVVSGSFAAGTDVSFAGLEFAGAASADYRVEYDDFGGVVSESLSLGLSGARLSIRQGGEADPADAVLGAELVLSGEVQIVDGAVESASFSAGTDVALGPVVFAGEARVEYTAGRLELVVDGGQVVVAGSTLVVGGHIVIEGGALTCGELETAAAATAALGGIEFKLGLKYAGAGTTCVWRDGTTTVSQEARMLVSLRDGRLSVGPAELTLAGHATLEGGVLACAELDAMGGAAVPVGGVSFAAGARFAAAGRSCEWGVGAGELELTLRRGVVQVAGQAVSLSGAAVLGGGRVVSASFVGEAALVLPGLAAGMSVQADYVAATGAFSLTLGGGEIVMAGTTFALEAQAEVVGGQVGCLIFEIAGSTSGSTSGAVVVAGAVLEVGARMAAAGFQCAWMDEPAESSLFEVTLAGDVVIAGAASAFVGSGKVVGGEVVCAELGAVGEVVVPIGEASFDVGVRYAAAGSSCEWGDGTETSPDQQTLLASLANGTLVLGGVSLTMAGTGELEGGELACAELRAEGGAGFEVAGVSFRAGARYAAAGRDCGWSEGLPAVDDTLEATLHEGAVAVAGASLTLAGSARIEDGAVRCATLSVESTGLAFGGIPFQGSGRFVAAGATCEGDPVGLSIALSDGRVEVAGTTVVLSGSGAVVDGALECVTFVATGEAPALAGLSVEVGGFYGRAGADCGGSVVSEDTFALTLVASAGSASLGAIDMDGLGRVEDGALACAELNARSEITLAGVSFDVGGRYVGGGRTCTWADGTTSIVAAEDASTFVAILRNGTLSVGGQTLVLSGEGVLRDGRVACATLDAVGAVGVELGGVSFEVGARYAAEGESCGWSDGTELELTLKNGAVALGASSVLLSGKAELSGGRVTCATLRGEAAAGVELGGVSFGVGARYAAAGQGCGWSDGAEQRFELTLEDGVLAIGPNTFTLSGSARMAGGAVACAELTSTGQVALGGTTFTVGGRYVGAGQTCVWSDGSETSAAPNSGDTFAVYLDDGAVSVAGVTLGLSGMAVARNGRLACAELEASSSLDFEVGGVGFEMGGARHVAAGETCVWGDGTTTSALADTFRMALRDGVLMVGNVRLTLSGMAEISGGQVTCADLSAGGGVRLDVGGVRFAAGARFAAEGHACGWSDGVRDVLQVTLDDGSVEVGGVAVGLRGAAEIGTGRLTCADFEVTSNADLVFGGVTFAAGARFAAQGEDCGWSDGTTNRLEVTLENGSVDVGTGAVVLSGGGVVVGGRLVCATLTTSGRSEVGGLAFDVTGRFAAAGQRCAGAAEPATANTFELVLANGSMRVGTANLALSGTGRVTGGRLSCAELEAAGGVTAAVGGVSFDLGARYVAAGETCTWADGSTTGAIGTGGALMLALKDGSLAVGGQTLNLSGVATLQDGVLACASLDAVGAASVELAGLSFSAGARYAAAGFECPWTEARPASVFELTLNEGALSVGGVDTRLSGAAQISNGQLTCADLAVMTDVPLELGGVAFEGKARFAAAGSGCGWSDASAERMEVVLDGSVSVGSNRVALRGVGQVVGRKLACVEFEGAGQATLGGLSFEVGARFSAAGATCEWTDSTDGPVANDRLEVVLSGASVPANGVAIELTGRGLVEGGRVTCAELGSSVDVTLAGVAFDVGARFSNAGSTCTWADGTTTDTAATTFTLALMNGTLQVGPVALGLSGAATLSGGQLTCAELASSGSVTLGGVSFSAGARYSAAGRACTWRDGTTTTTDAGTLDLVLYDGAVSVGPASVTLSGKATVANATLTCANFDVTGDLELGGIRFDGGARYAAAGQTCGWPGRVPTAATFELELRDGGLDVGDASVRLSGLATIGNGLLACASLQTAGGATVGLGGVTFQLGARYAAANSSCGGVTSPVTTFELTLDEGRLAVGPATLNLSGTAKVAAGRLTCAELDAIGGATVDLAGVAFSAGARFATAGSTCTWADGSTTDADATALMLALRNGTLTVGPTTLTLSGSATLFASQVACAELDAAGAANLDLAGVSFDAGAHYAGAGHSCTWADGTTRSGGPRALMLALRNGTLSVGTNTLSLAGTANLEAGRLTCAELESSGTVDLAGVTFAAGARYLATNSTCTWRDGTTASASAPRLDLALHDGQLSLGVATVTLSGSATLLANTLACAELASTTAARHSLAGVAFEIGARYSGANQACPWGTTPENTMVVTLEDGVLDVEGQTISLSGTAEVADNRLTCASLTSSGTIPVGGVNFSAGARYTAAQSTCPWSPIAPAAARLELTLAGDLTVGANTFALSGAGTLEGNRLTCAELAASSRLALADVSFGVGARYAAARQACVFADRSVSVPRDTASLWLTLDEGEVNIGSTRVTLAGSATLANNRLVCAELDATADVSLAGLAFEGGARFNHADETCTWRDGTSTTPRSDTFVMTLRDGSLDVGSTALWLSGQAAVVNGRASCVTFAASASQSFATPARATLDGVSFDLGARFAAANQSCPFAPNASPDDRLEVTLANGLLAIGPTRVTLAGAATLEGSTLTCAELEADGDSTISLADTTFAVGARYAAANHLCAWSDGTVSAPTANTLAVRLSGALTIAGQAMTVSGNATLERGALTCAELANTGAATVELGGVTFETGARYTSAGQTCTWSDGTSTTTDTTYALDLALHDGLFTLAGQQLRLSGQAAIAGNSITNADLTVSLATSLDPRATPIALSGVSFIARATYSATTDTLDLSLADGRLEAGATTLSLAGTATIDTATRSVNCLALDAAGTSSADLAGITFDVGARYTAAGATCAWTTTAPAAATFEATLRNGTLTLPDGSSVTVNGTGTIVGGRITCATFSAAGQVGTTDGLGFGGTARYAAQGEHCGWRDPLAVDAPALSLDMRTTLTIGDNVLTLSGAGSLQGSTVTCVELETTGDVALAGVAFQAHARFAGADQTCLWSDGSTSEPGPARLEVVLDDGTLALGETDLHLTGLAVAERSDNGYTVPCMGFDARVATAFPLGGLDFDAAVHFSDAQQQCPWDTAPVAARTLTLALNNGALAVGSATATLSGSARIANARVDCLELAASSDITGFADLTFEVGARYSAANTTCTWYDTSTTTSATPTFTAFLANGALTVGDQSVTLSGSATVEDATLTCAQLEAAGDFSVELVDTNFEVDARYAAAQATCPWRTTPPTENTFTLALSGDLDIDGQTARFTGDAELEGTRLTCATLTTSASIPLGGLTAAASARYAGAGSTCGWNLEATERLQLGLDTALNLGTTTASLSGFADLTNGRLACAELAVSGDTSQAFGGIAMAGQAHYAAAATTCTFSDNTTQTGSFTLALSGDATIGATTTRLSAATTITGRNLTCLDFETSIDATLDGLTLDASATWAAPNTACGNVPASPSATLTAHLDGTFAVGPSSVAISGSGLIVDRRLQCLDFAATNNVTVPLGNLDVAMAARFAARNATCTWDDGTTSNPTTDTLFASLSGDLAVGADTLALSGNGLIANGQIACAELAADGDLSLAGVTFDAGARYSAANRACTWADGTSTAAPQSATLKVALDRGAVRVGDNTITLNGEAELDQATGLTCATFAVDGDVALAGVTFAATAHYAAQNRTCGAWDTTASETFRLAVTDGSLRLGDNLVTVTGDLAIDNRKVTSGNLAVTGNVALAGLAITPRPATPLASLAYTASFGPDDNLTSQSLTLGLAGRLAINTLGTFDVDANANIANGALQSLRLELGTQLTLAGAAISADTIALDYQNNPRSLELLIEGGHIAIAGLGNLDISGRTLLANGTLQTLSLDIATDLMLADLTVSGGASLLYTASPATLILTVDGASATVTGLGTLTLSGQAILVSGVLDSLSLAASGALSIANVALTGQASLEFQRVDPITLTPSLHLALTDGRLTIAPFGNLDVSGEIAIAEATLQSFALDLDSTVDLAGLRLSGGLSLAYTAVTSTFRFAVNDAGLTVVGLGSFLVSGNTAITNGRLASFSLTASGNLDLNGVAIAGDLEFLYDATPPSTIRFAVSNGQATILGLGTLSVAGHSVLQAGRLTSLSLAVSGDAALQGVALSGALSLDYLATYNAQGTTLTRSLTLAVDELSLAVPQAELGLSGSLTIDNGQVTCATFGPAFVALSNLDFEASAAYIAAGQTCDRLATPATAATLSAAFATTLTFDNKSIAVTGSGTVVGGRIDAIAFTATVGLDGFLGIERLFAEGSYTGGTLCLAGDVAGTVTLPLGAEIRGLSAGLCATSSSLESLDVRLHALVPNLVGEPVELVATAGFDGAATQVEATLCLASTDTQSGRVCCAGSSESCPATTWHPFNGGLLPGLPGEWAALSVTTLQGKAFIGSSVGFEVLGVVDASALPEPVPGLSLDELAVSLKASAGATTMAAAGISGRFTVPFGQRPIPVMVSGNFQAGGGQGLSLSLAGSIGDRDSGVSADFEPLRDFIGENTFEISYLEVAVSASLSGVAFTLAGGANISIPDPVGVGPISLQVEGGGQLGRRTGAYLVGAICGIDIPAGLLPAGFEMLEFGQPSPCDEPPVAVALATRAYPEIEIVPGTSIRRGLTLVTNIKAPRGVLAPLGLVPADDDGPASAPLFPTAPSITAEIGIDTSGLRLKGALNLPWQVIRPDWNMPAIRLLQLENVAFEVLLSSAPTLTFSGSALFEPAHCLPDYQSFIEAGLESNDSPFEAFDPSKIKCLDLPVPFRDLPQQAPLRGTASFRYRPPKEFGGEISLQGMWYEPFWIPNVGIASPGLTIDIRLIDGPYGVQIPVPTSLGVNGDVFAKRPYYDDASASPSYPITCNNDSDCTGFGDCSNGACPTSCVRPPTAPGGEPQPGVCRYSWPYLCSSPDPDHPDAACIDSQYQPADVPASLASAGLTLFYDVYPTPSGILIPLPTLIVRREFNNLDPLDIIPAVDELKDGARNLFRWMELRLPGVSPALSPFEPCVDLDGDGTLDKSFSCIFPSTPLPNIFKDLPFNIALDRARLYLSTHERDLFGTTFAPGVNVDLDVELTEVGAATCNTITPCAAGLTCDNGTCKRMVYLSGGLGPTGLSLEGRASPVSFLDTVTIKGDPFSKVADTRLGHLEVASSPALESLPGTFETWVKHSASPGQWQTVARHIDLAGNGYAVQVGDLTPRCDARYSRCDSGQCAKWTCEGVQNPAISTTPPCADNGAQGQCSTCPEGADNCELPCISDAECVGLTGDSASTCVGYRASNPDAATLTRAKALGLDLDTALASSAATCTDAGNRKTCAAANFGAAVQATAGSPLSALCTGCIADFVRCDDSARLRVDVLTNNTVTRTVETPALIPVDGWTHLAVSFDDPTGAIDLYIDGLAIETTDTANRPSCGAACGCHALCLGDPESVTCAGCAAELFPDLSAELARAAVATSCSSCETELATWLTNASAAGHWPAPGAGAKVLLGEGVDGLDDVRLWNIRRTADQIAETRAALPQDATPEEMGDCSNAGPGTCSGTTKSCDNDFDCTAPATCVGQIPKGTCRTNSDCGGVACLGYVPPTQRYAFDDNLIARYEFDFDSYQSGLDRAWNTRYYGDPADGGIDCVETPILPPTNTCGLIGTPCKDYDRTSAHKLHAHYREAATWATAIDAPGVTLMNGADDLHLSVKVPFSSAILKVGGFGVRGGVAFTVPDWLPVPDALKNGGARVDVLLAGTTEARGELYMKSFDLLELGQCGASTTPCTRNDQCTTSLFGLPIPGYCRDDGLCTTGMCLGRLMVSGYGPNGIDDGIDDGFYARTNLHAKPLPTFSAGARVSVESAFSPREDLAFASYELQCPPNQTCNSAADYRLSLSTGLELDLPLPFAGPNDPTHLFKVCGNAVTYKPGLGDPTPDWILTSSYLCPSGDPSFGTFVDGSIEVMNQTLMGSALLTSCGFKIRSAIDLGKVNIGDFNLPSMGTFTGEVTGRFSPFRVCSEGDLTLDLELPYGAPYKLLDLDAAVSADVCFGEATKYPGLDSGNFMKLLSRPGAPARLAFFSKDGGPSLFEMTGSVDMCVGNGDVLRQGPSDPVAQACEDTHLILCGSLNLFGGLVALEQKCLELRTPHIDITFSLHEQVQIALPGLPTTNSQLFLEMCPMGQYAEFDRASNSVACRPATGPNASNFKMSVPLVVLRFGTDLTVAGGSFGNIDLVASAEFLPTGIEFRGAARYNKAVSTVVGFEYWAPDFCDIDVTLALRNGALSLEGGAPRCSGYCFTANDCSGGESCNLGRCERCGNGICAFGENSLNCEADCGLPVGRPCAEDDECASSLCFTPLRQIAVLKDIDFLNETGICLPCLPGAGQCPSHQYCDGFQLFECRDKAPYGTFCLLNEACQSDKCQFDTFWGGSYCAECTDDSQCGADEWCDNFSLLSPTPPDYKCHPRAPTGGKCGVGPFIGATDDNCQAGNFCDVDGTCHAEAGLGVLCTGDRVCSSDHCCFKGIGSFCGGCCTKADCDNPEDGCYVSDGNILASVCRPGREGEACADNQECASDNCVSGFCRTKQPNGYVGCATLDGRCQSGHCCVDTCQECCSDVDCGALRCYGGTCRLGNDGDPCDENADCAPGKACTSPVFGKCYTPGTQQNWEVCQTGAECNQGQQCILHGFEYLCHCERHDQCPGGFCDLGIWTAATTDGKCGTKQPAGAYCEDNVWCQGGLVCSNNTCVVPASKNNWEACTANSECVSGECWNGKCRCTSQNDCHANFGTGWYCDEGTWFADNQEGRCHPKLPDDNAPYCESAGWCQSGRCDWSPRLNRNICWSPVPQGYNATCNLNGHCASNSCSTTRGHVCNPVAFTIPNNVRHYCEDDAWCQGGGVCRYSWDINVARNVCVAPANRVWAEACDHDMQCGGEPGLGCKYWPVGGGGVGRPDVGIGYFCGF